MVEYSPPFLAHSKVNFLGIADVQLSQLPWHKIAFDSGVA